MDLYDGHNVKKDVKKKLTKKFPTLTDDDFDQESSDKLLIHLRQKLGKSRAELRKIINDN